MKYNQKDRNKIGIYAIENTLNNKIYVGKSKNIDTRIRAHVTMLNKKSKDENRHLIRAWHKYGRNNFKYYVLEYLPLNEKLIKEREYYWIIKLNTLDRECGYNLRLDSTTKLIVSEETRKLMSKSGKQRFKNNPSLRKEFSDKHTKFWKDNPIIKQEMKKKVSNNHTNYRIVQFDRKMNLINEFNTQLELRTLHPELYLPAILQVCNGNKASYLNYFWRYRCIKTNEIIFQKERRSKRTEILMIDKFTHEILKIFKSGTEAAKYVGQSASSNISKMCIEETFYKTKDYYFRFKKT
jgi:group I intron endonuclease